MYHGDVIFIQIGEKYKKHENILDSNPNIINPIFIPDFTVSYYFF